MYSETVSALSALLSDAEEQVLELELTPTEAKPPQQEIDAALSPIAFALTGMQDRIAALRGVVPE